MSLMVQAGRFGLVGLLNTVVGLATILACQEMLQFPAVASNAIGYAVGLVLSFVLNRSWTFDSSEGASAFGRFLLAFLLAYFVNLATVLALIEASLVTPMLAQIAGVLPYTAVFFLLSRYFVFVGGGAGCKT